MNLLLILQQFIQFVILFIFCCLSPPTCHLPLATRNNSVMLFTSDTPLEVSRGVDSQWFFSFNLAHFGFLATGPATGVKLQDLAGPAGPLGARPAVLSQLSVLFRSCQPQLQLRMKLKILGSGSRLALPEHLTKSYIFYLFIYI